ncbi:hypothetical protein Dimus_027133 [Dionaea muscipula]
MMLLGKRPRQPIKRTTSMTVINFDPSSVAASGSQTDQNRPPFTLGDPDPAILAMVSPRVATRRNSSDFVPSNSNSSFLRVCSLCNRRLVPGRDIYMYRGDSAYCSQECRQQQVNMDERKEKAASRCSAAAAAAAATMKQQASTTSSSPASSNADPIAAMY